MRTRIIFVGLCGILSASAGCGVSEDVATGYPRATEPEADKVGAHAIGTNDLETDISAAHCASRSDFFKVVSSVNGTHCWANAGMANVSYGGTVNISTGNNAGFVLYYPRAYVCNPGHCPGPTDRGFGKFSSFSFSFPPGGGIVQIHIN